MPKIREIVERFNLDEPSTYNAFALGLVGVGVYIPEPIIQSTSLILSGIFTLFGWLKSEKGKTK